MRKGLLALFSGFPKHHFSQVTEQGLSFGEHCVIDKRTEPETAKKLVVKYCFTATEISDYKITHGYAIISDICSKGR